MNHYSTDLTDNRWQVIEKFLDVQVRKRKYSLRSIVNAIIADGGYRGKLLSDTLKATLGCGLEVVLRPDERQVGLCRISAAAAAETRLLY